MTDRATSSRPAKRQRTETVDITPDNGNPVAAKQPEEKPPTIPEFWNGSVTALPGFNGDVDKLVPQIIRLPARFNNKLLVYAAARDPFIKSIIEYRYGLQKARQYVDDFSQYTKSVWDMLNTKYRGVSGVEAGRIADKVTDDITGIFCYIADHMKERTRSRAGCSYAAKKNLLEALVDIMVFKGTAPDTEMAEMIRLGRHMANDMERTLLDVLEHNFNRMQLVKLDADGLTDKLRKLIDVGEDHSGYDNDVLEAAVAILEGDDNKYRERDEEEAKCRKCSRLPSYSPHRDL